MSQKKDRLLKQFAEASQERAPGLNLRHSRVYYDSLSRGAKEKFCEEIKQFLLAPPIKGREKHESQ